MKKYDTQDIDGRAFRRVALVSDTHGPLNPGIARLMTDHDCIVHAGDVGGLVGFGRFEQSVYAVYGNNDEASKWAVNERPALQRLAECLRISLPGGVLIVIHGHQFVSAKTRHQKLRESVRSGLSEARAFLICA